jgi:hypothetical protein
MASLPRNYFEAVGLKEEPTAVGDLPRQTPTFLRLCQ